MNKASPNQNNNQFPANKGKVTINMKNQPEQNQATAGIKP